MMQDHDADTDLKMASPTPPPTMLSRAKRRRMPNKSSDSDGDGESPGKAVQLEALQEALQAEEEWLQVSDQSPAPSRCPECLCHCRLDPAGVLGMRRVSAMLP